MTDLDAAVERLRHPTSPAGLTCRELAVREARWHHDAAAVVAAYLRDHPADDGGVPATRAEALAVYAAAEAEHTAANAACDHPRGVPGVDPSGEPAGGGGERAGEMGGEGTIMHAEVMVNGELVVIQWHDPRAIFGTAIVLWWLCEMVWSVAGPLQPPKKLAAETVGFMAVVAGLAINLDTWPKWWIYLMTVAFAFVMAATSFGWRPKPPVAPEAGS